MDTSNLIALGALLVSAGVGLAQLRILKRQNDLERVVREYQVEQVRAATEYAQRAQLELICYNKEHLTVRNSGGADARDVTVVCDCPNGESAFPANLNLFPLDRLGPNRSVQAALALASGCWFPLPATVAWTDPDGSRREEPVTLRLE